MAKFDKDGRQVCDPTPVEVPLNVKRPPTMEEMIQRQVRVELSRAMDAQGFETFEEADDFEIDEDPDPLSGYEIVEMVREPGDGPDASPPGPPGPAPTGSPAPETPADSEPAGTNKTESQA